MIRRFGLPTLLALWACTGIARAQDIRVHILGEAAPTSIIVQGQTGGLELFAAEYDDPLTRVGPGQEITVSARTDQLHVETADVALFARSLRIVPDGDGDVRVRIVDGASRPDERSYAGSIQVSRDGSGVLQLVNVVDLEDYVASVVASEYGLGDLEGAKAMAVIARTYALSDRGRHGTEFDHVDNTRSQMYLGSGAVTPVSRRAADETAGEVLTYDGKLAHAVYFSSSGGHTADNEDVWDGPPLPYLRGKSDPYGGSSPHTGWNVRIPRSELLSHLSKQFDTRVDGFLIDQRSQDGRVESVELLLAGGGSRIVSGNAFRLAISERFGIRSLRSTMFDARREGDHYVFSGRGFGHGVGLSQWGAHEMAERGMTYEQILGFYYTGVQLATLDSDLLTPDPASLAALPTLDSGRHANDGADEIAVDDPAGSEMAAADSDGHDIALIDRSSMNSGAPATRLDAESGDFGRPAAAENSSPVPGTNASYRGDTVQAQDETPVAWGSPSVVKPQDRASATERQSTSTVRRIGW